MPLGDDEKTTTTLSHSRRVDEKAARKPKHKQTASTQLHAQAEEAAATIPASHSRLMTGAH